MKSMFLSTVGPMAALGHVAAGDEVLKTSFAYLAFENHEIPASTSLIPAAQVDLAMLAKSLEEERRVADWVADQIPAVTRAPSLPSRAAAKAPRGGAKR